METGKTKQLIQRYSVPICLLLLFLSTLFQSYFTVSAGVYTYADALYRLSGKQIGMAGVWIFSALIDTVMFELLVRGYFFLADRLVSFRLRPSVFVNQCRYYAILRNAVLALISLLILWSPVFLPFYLITAGFLVSAVVYGIFVCRFILKRVEPERRPKAFVCMCLIYLLFLVLKSIWGLFA